MLCYLKFHFKQQLCGEEHQYTKGTFLFFLKKPSLNNNNNKKVINITYLIIVLLKMKLLIFLVFSQYGLACTYGIIL